MERFVGSYSHLSSGNKYKYKYKFEYKCKYKYKYKYNLHIMVNLIIIIMIIMIITIIITNHHHDHHEEHCHGHYDQAGLLQQLRAADDRPVPARLALPTCPARSRCASGHHQYKIYQWVDNLEHLVVLIKMLW